MKNLLVVIFLMLLSCDSFQKRRLLKTEEYKHLIGTWEVTESSLVPFEHRFNCKKLDLHAIFSFNKRGDLDVYENEESRINCNVVQLFEINDNALILSGLEATSTYEILKLTENTLILKTDVVPFYFYNEENIKNDSGLYSKQIEDIRKNGIIITLTKKQSIFMD